MRWTRFALNHPKSARVLALTLSFLTLPGIDDFLLGYKWT